MTQLVTECRASRVVFRCLHLTARPLCQRATTVCSEPHMFCHRSAGHHNQHRGQQGLPWSLCAHSGDSYLLRSPGRRGVSISEHAMLRRAALEQLEPAAHQSGGSDYSDGCRQLHRTANQEAAGSNADLLIKGPCHYLRLYSRGDHSAAGAICTRC